MSVPLFSLENEERAGRSEKYLYLPDLLRDTLDVSCDEVWENERTPTPIRVFPTE